ncbi:MAG: N-acetylmuramoyl-L-alanine amidase [Marmoricola sp.]
MISSFAGGRVDGYFGVETSTGLTDFQRNYGLVTDGTCGPETLKALTRLSPMVQGRCPHAMGGSRIRAAGPNLSDKVIVIDISRAHNLPDAHSETSDIIVKDLAQRIAGRFGATGVSAYLTTSSFGSADLQEERERARFANELRADLLIAIALDYSENPEAKGISAYFFGDTNHDTWSTTGEKLAGLIQREIVARTGMTNLRSHAKTWDLLRMTRMPAMWMDIGYVRQLQRRHGQIARRLTTRPDRRSDRRGDPALLSHPGGRRRDRSAQLCRHQGQAQGISRSGGAW